METYAESGLKEEIIKAVTEMGFEKPTPIQAKAIPHLTSEKGDLVALAQTGTGKTAAFSLPICEQVDPSDRNIQAFILSPTRELALQIANDIKDFTKYLRGVKVVPVYGGARIDTQIRQLQDGCQIVAGTPGRVCDLIRRKKLDLSNINWVVLDEADEMLSMGFKEELDFILEQTPDEKQTLLFSATMPKDISRIAKKYMTDPFEITAGTKNSGAKNVEHVFYPVSFRNKYNTLKRIADINPDIYGIIFCRTRRETKEIADKLMADGYNADALHGDLSQAQRDVVMGRFRAKHLQILVATDVAARGIDVNDLTHVINYNLPDNPESYIHRSGRTGRAGKAGISIAIISSKEVRKIRTLERMVGKDFTKGIVPKGRDITEVRLFDVIKKLKAVEVDEENIAEFMPAIHENLGDLDKEDLVKRIVSVEFNRLLAYYKNAPDLNERDNGRDRDRGRDRDDRRRGRDRDRDRGRNRDRDRGGDRERGRGRDRDRDRSQRAEDNSKYTRFHINVGSKQELNPARLMGIINDFPTINKADIGQIEIFKKFSFFDIDAEYHDEVLKTFNGTEFEGNTIKVEPVKTPPKPSKRRGGDRDRKRRSPDSNRARRSRDRDKFKKKRTRY